MSDADFEMKLAWEEIANPDQDIIYDVWYDWEKMYDDMEEA